MWSPIDQFPPHPMSPVARREERTSRVAFQCSFLGLVGIFENARDWLPGLIALHTLLNWARLTVTETPENSTRGHAGPGWLHCVGHSPRYKVQVSPPAILGGLRGESAGSVWLFPASHKEVLIHQITSGPFCNFSEPLTRALGLHH